MPTVHLADRDEAYRTALARALHRSGVEVLEFSSGAEVFARTLERPPDLVVLETDLDEADGFQVFKWLQARPQAARLPVVFLSAFEHPEVARVCKERGARDFIGKGRELDLVVERLLTALGERDPLSGRSLPAALAWLQSRGKSGRLQAQACGQTGTILLHGGRIVGAHWDAWRGEDALRLMTEVHSASTFRFAEGLDEIVHGDTARAEETAPPADVDARAEATSNPVLDLPPVAESAAEDGGAEDESVDDQPIAVCAGAPVVLSPDGEDAEPRLYAQAPEILIGRERRPTRRRDRATLSLAAAGVAVLLTAGLTVTSLLDGRDPGAAAAEGLTGSRAAPATPEIPPPLSIVHSAGAPEDPTARPDGDEQRLSPVPSTVSERGAVVPIRPPADAAAAVPAEPDPAASLASAPGVAAGTPAPVAPRPAAPAPTQEPNLAAVTPPSTSPVGPSAPPVVAAVPLPAPAPASLLEVREAPVNAFDPAEISRRQAERRRELALLEREARATRLDAAPELRQPLRFRYPRELAQQKVGGSVELLVELDPTGRVGDVRVLRSSGSEALDAAAAEAVSRSSYVPPRRDGQAVSAWIRQPVVGMCCRADVP